MRNEKVTVMEAIPVRELYSLKRRAHHIDQTRKAEWVICMAVGAIAATIAMLLF